MDSDDSPKVFMALPDRTVAEPETFRGCLAAVVEIIGLQLPSEKEFGDRDLSWENRARLALRRACRDGITLTAEAFDVLLKAAVYDPDPSFNRQFIEPALNAFGRRRVRAALLNYLQTGTAPERAGAARAWYWSAYSLRMPLVRAQGERPEPDESSVLARDWNAAALREFVSNDDLDVRRCILPGLPLSKSAYASELHELVDSAIAIARSHPDNYIRHRVEHQVDH